MRLVILILILICSINGSAQNWEWVKSFGGSGNESINELKSTLDEGFVVAGSYSDGVQFGNETLEAISGSDAFLMKLNDLCEVEWAVSGGSSSNDLSYDVEVDSEGNLIWLGSYWTSAIFESDTIFPVTGSLAFFVAKYNPEGELLWVNSIDGNQLKFVNDLVIDEFDDLYMTGFFRDSLIVDDVELKSAIDEDAFIIKMSGDGLVLWGKQYGESGTIRPATINLDSAGDLIIGGNLIGTVTFGNDQLTSVNTDFDIFIAKINSNGDSVWGTIGTGVFDNRLNSLELDQADQIYVTGGFEGVMDIGDESIQTPGNNSNLYLVKLNSAGEPLWARGLNDQVFNDQSTSLDLAIISDHVFLTGRFLNELIIDELEIEGDDQLKAFLGSFDVATGLVEQLYLIPGTSQTIGVNLMVDNEERLHLGGLYLDDLLLADEVFSSEGATDFFIAKASENFTSTLEIVESNPTIQIYPNPATHQININSSIPFFEVEVEVFDSFGRLMIFSQSTESFNIDHLLPGIYILKLKSEQGFHICTIVKM